MHRHELVVDVLGESVGCPFLLAIQRSEIEFVNGVAVICGLILFNQWVVAVYSDITVVVRD